ncbi:MAG: hypothetical protein FJW31_19650 [Acidobacteria bacterium]|nr:hypothetical protein [Acidobacteriota bacterium]
MSYLDFPRFHFFGRCSIDPPTINNIRQNYNTGNTDPTPFWCPHGSGDFWFVDCLITSAFEASGRHLHLEADDALIGGPLGCREDPDRGAAKLVDLDTDQQNVSTVYGMRLQWPLRGTNRTLVAGVDPVSAKSLWPNVIQTFGFGQVTMTLAAASFQTVVGVAEADWPEHRPESPVLQNLREACAVVNGCRVLSLKFVIDASITGRASAQFSTGRVVGTLGPWKQGEPYHCPNRRWLVPGPKPNATSPPPGWKSQWPPWDFASFNGAPFCVDETHRRFTIDPGNSRQFTTPGGPAVNAGRLVAVIPDSSGDPAKETVHGLVDYSESRHRKAAGIAELALTPDQIALLATRPLQIEARIAGLNRVIVLAEDPASLDYALDQRVFRMAHDTPEIAVQTTTAYVTRFGKPAAGVELSPQLQPSATGGVPCGSDCIHLEAGASDECGQAVILIRAVRNPGHPLDRPGGLDGQVFLFELLTGPRQTNVARDERLISIHLYEDCPVPQTPSWKQVRDIFMPYKALYPNMFERVDLTDPDAFRAFAPLIAQRLQLPFDHPKYMPVTRDMSPHKTQLVLSYLQGASKAEVLLPLPLSPVSPPYQLSFAEKQYPPGQPTLPALQSFCAARLPGSSQWLIVGGQTKGIHGFALGDDLNPNLYLIDPETRRFQSFGLVGQLKRPSVTEPLTMTNAQSFYTAGWGYYYQLGGYGSDGNSARPITFDTLTRFRLADMIAAITESPQPRLARILGLIEQVRDARVTVTGGALLRLGGQMFLVCGQNFTVVVGELNSTAIYTEQVRCFHLRADGVLGTVDSTYGATPDPGNHEFHRRDLNVVPTSTPTPGTRI